MNTRGLMELVVLNIGYNSQGVLLQNFFTMMVIMALATTATGPALDPINYLFKTQRQ
jgi:Kef-type K+ transport system membrane component KefB